MRRATPAALALATIAGALLVGCTPEPPAETTPPPTADPTVNEDDMARELFDRYWQITVDLSSSDQQDRSAFADIATVEVAEDALRGIEIARETNAIPTSAPEVSQFVRSETGYSACTVVASLNIETLDGEPIAPPASPVEVQWDVQMAGGLLSLVRSTDLSEATLCEQ